MIVYLRVKHGDDPGDVWLHDIYHVFVWVIGIMLVTFD
jgi:hypothetical protein